MQNTDRKQPVAATQTRGSGLIWPHAAAGNEDHDGNVTAAVDPNDPTLRAWFVAESRRLQADREQRLPAIAELQRIMPDAADAARLDDDQHQTTSSDNGR